MAEKGTNLLCEKEVAQLFNVSVKTIQRGRYDGDGPPWLKIRGTIRYRYADLMSYLEKFLVTR